MIKSQITGPDLEAEVYYLTADEGGRYTPVQTGYRGQFHYNEKDWDAIQEFTDKEICYPGESVHVKILTISPIFHYGRFYVGQEFEIREGTRIMAKGTISKILRTDFEYWDYETFYEKLPTECQPHHAHSVAAITKSIKSSFAGMRGIETFKFSKIQPDKKIILVIHCIGDDKMIGLRTLAECIYQCLISLFSAENLRYKTEVTSQYRYEILFAVHTNQYLTGKIVISARGH